MVESALNYDPLANAPCSGANTNPDGAYMPDGVTLRPYTDDDGSWSTCTALAQHDNCCCSPAIAGCMTVGATNYNPEATVDDGTECVIEASATNECDANPCENVYYFQTNAAFGSTRVGSTDGVCEEAWVCTDPNEHVL